MSSVELLSDRSSVTDASFRSMTEEQRNALQPPHMGGRAGAGITPVVPALNIPTTGPLPSGQDPSSGSGVRNIFQQYNVYAPQRFEFNLTQVRSEVLELEERAETVHRAALESVEQAAEHSLADIEQRAEHVHLQKVGNLENTIATCEHRAARREQMLLEELVSSQRTYAASDDRLRRELQELENSKITYALDVQMQENMLAQRLQEQAASAIQESQHELVQQFQANFEQHRLRTREEHMVTVSELQEQNDELQERLESAERAFEKSLQGHDTATPKGQPSQASNMPEPQHSSSFPSAPKAPMFSMPNVIPPSARELFNTMNPQATTTAHAPPQQQQQAPNDSPGFVPPGETAHPAAEHGAPSLGNQLLLETQRAILESLENLKGNKGEGDSKPKVKEAEVIKLPEFPTPESYRSWKTAVREKIRAASDNPDEAFEWILEVYRSGASHDTLRNPGKFVTLDTKLLEALTTCSRGELARDILIYKETEAAKDVAVRGRQVLYLFDQYFKTNEEVGSLYSVEDLLKVRLINDDLSTFLSNWESVMSGLSHTPDETTLRDIFLRELRQSKRLKYDLEIYDRAKEGSDQHTYAFLKNSIREMLTRERKRKNRDRIARSHGDKYGAAASPRSTSPSHRGGRERSQSPRSPRPRSPSRGRSQSPNKSRTPSPKGVCYDFLKGTCKRGKNCPFLHKKRSLSPGGQRTPKKINKTCKFWKLGTCTKGDKCRFQHKDVETPSAPAPKSEAAPAAPKPGSPRANSPAPKPRGRSPRPKSRGKPDKPAACAFAAAAPRGPQNDLEDSWEVDFKSGRLIRHHRTYRKDWFLPDNSCPINAKKLRSQVKVERVLPIAPYVANQQFDWRQQTPQKPDDLWVGKTIFFLRPIPKVSFDNQVQMIAVEPEGKGRKHAYLPRVHSESYATARDCPRPNPQDLARALVWAKQFERVAECMVSEFPAACHYQCDEEGLMCEHCERTVRPSCAGLVPGLEFLADTGSEEDLISRTDAQVHFPGTPIGKSERPVSLITANGPVQGNASVKLDVPELGSTLECYVLESTPPVCSVGRRCMDEGFDFHWYAGKSPYFVTPEGKKLYCKLRGRVPVIGENAIASPATGNKAINGPVLRVSDEQGFPKPAAY